MTPDALRSRQSATRLPGARPIIFVSVGAALVLDGLSGAEVNGILQRGRFLLMDLFWTRPLPNLSCRMS